MTPAVMKSGGSVIQGRKHGFKNHNLRSTPEFNSVSFNKSLNISKCRILFHKIVKGIKRNNVKSAYDSTCHIVGMQ